MKWRDLSKEALSRRFKACKLKATISSSIMIDEDIEETLKTQKGIESLKIGDLCERYPPFVVTPERLEVIKKHYSKKLDKSNP